METKIILKSHIDYVYETWELLHCLADAENVDDLYEKVEDVLKKKYRVKSDYVLACIQVLIEIMKEASLEFKEERTQIKRFFGEIELNITAFELITCFMRINPGIDSQRDAKELFEQYQNMTEQERDRAFYKGIVRSPVEEDILQITGMKKDGTVVSEGTRLRKMFSYIQKLEISPENKEIITDLYLNRDDYIEEVIGLLDRGIKVIKRHEKELKDLCDTWSIYWNREIEQGRFFEDCAEAVGKMIGKEKEVIIIPRIVQLAGNEIDYPEVANEADKKFMCLFRMGLTMSEGFGMKTEVALEYQQEDMQKKLKLLGDKSKFDLLLFVKDKPAYGGEIAKHLGLTTATVSHHYSKLLEYNLIELELVDGKLYCRANKKTLQSLFDQCKKMFE